MFENFTDSARQVILAAQEEAKNFNNNEIATVHLMLALHKTGDEFIQHILDITENTSDNLREIAEKGKGEIRPTGHIPFTEEVKTIIRFSSFEATKNNSLFVESLHLLYSSITFIVYKKYFTTPSGEQNGV